MDSENNPFETLRSCHRRLKERLGVLVEHGAKEDVVQVADDVLGFLERSARRHERDEEESLFPRLAADPALASVLATLSEEHKLHEELLTDLGYAVDAGDSAAIQNLARSLAASYDKHILLEESVLFPRAEELLDEAALLEMVEQMEARRGRGRPREPQP